MIVINKVDKRELTIILMKQKKKKKAKKVDFDCYSTKNDESLQICAANTASIVGHGHTSPDIVVRCHQPIFHSLS